MDRVICLPILSVGDEFLSSQFRITDIGNKDVVIGRIHTTDTVGEKSLFVD